MKNLVDYSGSEVRVGDTVDVNKYGVCKVIKTSGIIENGTARVTLKRNRGNGKVVVVEPYVIALGSKI